MKKLALLISVSLLSLTSCSNDDDKIQNTEASIVGIWKFKRGETLSGKDSNIVLETINDNCSKKDTYEFTELKKYIPIFHHVQNDKCIEQEKGGSINYKYDKENKKLYFRDRTDEYADIIELTDKSLIFGWSESDINKDGTIDYNKVYLYK